ncbi:BnaCnng07270D [Brassica napus]|uniref:BnaCnng07270D protein n=1 Tax=Brassica napus TaxID=3708 RepID=A0A078H8J8_BRANA|nr:BnaCnng07270D [Brassica napus]
MATRTRIFSFVFAMMMSFMVFSVYCSARIYTVGDSEGWTAKDDVYYAWAEADHKEFHVGDSLVFEYDPNINDVIHASGSLEYEFCDYSSPKAVYNTGHDVTYKVGDSQGWKLYNINDVYEISGDLEFITCDPTSPVAVHKTRQDLVRLTEPGVHYFVTSHSGYCEAGLKLRVMVGPLPKAVTLPSFPKKVDLSAMERLNNWLQTFKHQPHH